MLTSISLKNFKSYKDATLPLAAVTFLIGANASGKSNALEAVRLLHWLAKGIRLDDIERGIDGYKPPFRGYAEDLFMASNVPIEFEVGFSTANGQCVFKISIQSIKNRLQIVAEELISDSDKVPVYRVIGSTIGEPVIETSLPIAEGIKSLIFHGEQPVFYQLDSLFPATEQNWARELRLHLRNVFMLDAHPAAMRGYANMRNAAATQIAAAAYPIKGAALFQAKPVTHVSAVS